MESENVLKVKEAAEYLRISTSLLHRLCSEQQVPLHRIGRRVLFFASELESWLRTGGTMPDGTKKTIGVRRIKKSYDRAGNKKD